MSIRHLSCVRDKLVSQRQRRKSGCQAEVTAVVPEKDDGILDSKQYSNEGCAMWPNSRCILKTGQRTETWALRE